MTKAYIRFWTAALLAALALSAWPLAMGVRVVAETVTNGAVPIESYPKYVIPYAPLALALLAGVLLCPLLQKRAGKRDLLIGGLASTAVFYAAERLMETKVLVQTTETVALESWQMALCYVPPEAFETRTWEAVDVLLGGYSPAFKLHFYLISAVLLWGLLNSVYGFGRRILRAGTDPAPSESRSRGELAALIVQTAASLAFLGMCVWACFTAFYRTGELTVSPLSAALMAAFFVLLGLTAGMSAGSRMIGSGTGKERGRASRILPVLVPAAIAVLVTAAMYAGEMILLSGHLYRFGTGWFFGGLGPLVLSPADLCVTVLPGILTALICRRLGAGKE